VAARKWSTMVFVKASVSTPSLDCRTVGSNATQTSHQRKLDFESRRLGLGKEPSSIGKSEE
jgi:hypothetical protein